MRFKSRLHNTRNRLHCAILFVHKCASVQIYHVIAFILSRGPHIARLKTDVVGNEVYFCLFGVLKLVYLPVLLTQVITVLDYTSA